MCGRFALWAALNALDHYGVADDPGIVIHPSCNIAPGQDINDPDCIVPLLLPDGARV